MKFLYNVALFLEAPSFFKLLTSLCICKWSTSGHQCDLLCHDLKRKFEKLHSLSSGVLDDCQNFALKPTSSGTRTVFALKDRWSYMRITAPASLAGWRQICSDNIMRFASIYFKNSLCYDFFKTILNKYFVSLKSVTLQEVPSSYRHC